MKICEETVRKAVDESLSGLVMDDAQKQAILAKCRPELRTAKPHRLVRRTLAAAAAFAAVLTLGGGALAADPELRQSLSILGGATTRQLQPVNQTSIDQGIKMEVLAAINDGEVAVVFLSIQDMEGKGRVGPTSQLYTSEITGMGFTAGELIYYNEAEQTAYLRLSADSSAQMAGNKITVSTQSILGGEKILEPVDAGWTLAELDRILGRQKTRPAGEVMSYTTGGPEMETYSDLLSEGRVPVLKPWKEPYRIEQADWAAVTAAGMVDGNLHIQVAPDAALGQVNSLSFALADDDGKEVPCTILTLDLGPAGPGQPSVMEHILIPPEGADPETLHLQVGGVFYEYYLEGDWSTTFRLTKASGKMSFAPGRPQNGLSFSTVQVSPIAVTVRGSGEMNENGCEMEIEVEMQDGLVLPLSSSSMYSDGEGEVRIHAIFDRVIDLSQVAAVRINGESLTLQNR